MVIGGGVAGIQAALDIADAGYQVALVEREPSVGGKMAGLSETFPTLDCSQCILTPRMVDVGQHPNITLHTYSEVESVEGYVGNFKATIRKKARYIDMAKCTGCGQCWNCVPLEKDTQHVRLWDGQPHGHLRAVSPGRARSAGDRSRTPVCIFSRASAAYVPRNARPAPFASTTRTSSSRKTSAPSSWPPAFSFTASARSRRMAEPSATANMAMVE